MEKLSRSGWIDNVHVDVYLALGFEWIVGELKHRVTFGKCREKLVLPEASVPVDMSNVLERQAQDHAGGLTRCHSVLPIWLFSMLRTVLMHCIGLTLSTSNDSIDDNLCAIGEVTKLETWVCQGSYLACAINSPALPRSVIDQVSPMMHHTRTNHASADAKFYYHTSNSPLKRPFHSMRLDE